MIIGALHIKTKTKKMKRKQLLKIPKYLMKNYLKD